MNRLTPILLLLLLIVAGSIGCTALAASTTVEIVDLDRSATLAAMSYEPTIQNTGRIAAKNVVVAVVQVPPDQYAWFRFNASAQEYLVMDRTSMTTPRLDTDYLGDMEPGEVRKVTLSYDHRAHIENWNLLLIVRADNAPPQVWE